MCPGTAHPKPATATVCTVHLYARTSLWQTSLFSRLPTGSCRSSCCPCAGILWDRPRAEWRFLALLVFQAQGVRSPLSQCANFVACTAIVTGFADVHLLAVPVVPVGAAFIRAAHILQFTINAAQGMHTACVHLNRSHHDICNHVQISLLRQ